MALLCLCACGPIAKEKGDGTNLPEVINDSTEAAGQQLPEILPADIILSKELLYDKYTLDDTYPYKDTVRVFQWDRVREVIAKLENIQRQPQPWGILQNRKNKNGEAPLAHSWARNVYKNVADSLGVERYQGIPLFLDHDTIAPLRYGRDGELVHLLHNPDSGSRMRLQTIHVEGDWVVPRKYVKVIDTICFTKIAVVDRTNQNIATIEKADSVWLVRSMNPATTGRYSPPYAHETPLGIFVIQEKKEKMYYLVDGTSRIAGFAPHASRFCNGGYIHGVPVENPKGSIVEYSRTLGTTPRSHMCVRNASSHAKFVFDWAPAENALVVVIE